METKILLLLWSCLGLIGLALMFYRRDIDKFKNEANFILTKGTFFHKTTYVIIAILLLPFTIPYSIKELLRK